MLLQCKNCGFRTGYDTSLGNAFVCKRCSQCIIIIGNESEPGVKLEQDEEELLPLGTIVKITNKQHVWFDEIAIICGVKHRFYRLELHGTKMWVPYEWVIKDEPFYND